MENTIEKNLNHIFSLLKEAKFIEAMELYLHDDAVLQEGDSKPKHGKSFCVKFEQDFIDNQLAEFVRYDIGNYAIKGNHSFYDAVMELKLKDGSTMLSEQIVATEWESGQIKKERYYHS
ncbi:MAG: hypothetical protein ACI86M_002526 [Saprospiraceae bacterium]|jgi:hypothetical protein